MDFQEVGWEEDYPAQGRDRWPAVVNAVLNLQVP
jgi:hypothetical protein